MSSVHSTCVHDHRSFLRLVPATEPGHMRFPVRSHGAGWDWSLPEDLERSEPMQITLWIEADDTDDLDLSVGVEKWAAGRDVPFECSYGLAATGSRPDGSASLRSIDESTAGV
jgi:hypothetical protein